MPIREHAPNGSPCWADLWTSDVDGSRKFYAELFGWVAEEPSPEFGGYFMWTRNGIPVAGGMGDMSEEMRADDAWKIYLSTDDIDNTAAEAAAAGAQVQSPAMAVADLGSQIVLTDPTGATLGAWQPGTFPGFTVLNEPGAPSWFELHTRDHAAAVAFYGSVFHCEAESVADTDEFRYTMLRGPSGEQLAGIIDASNFLPEGAPPCWTIYWQVEDVNAAVAAVQALGGSVVMAAEDTPYGRLATVADPAGAQFRLPTPNA